MSRAAKEDAACMKKGGVANFIKGAIKKPGALHKDLGVPMGQKIPKAKIMAAAAKPGKVGQRARFAETLGTMKKAGGGKISAPRGTFLDSSDASVADSRAKSSKLKNNTMIRKTMASEPGDTPMSKIFNDNDEAVTDMQKRGLTNGYAAGGVAKARLGQSTMDGQQKKPSSPLKSPIGKMSMPKSSGRKGMI